METTMIRKILRDLGKRRCMRSMQSFQRQKLLYLKMLSKQKCSRMLGSIFFLQTQVRHAVETAMLKHPVYGHPFKSLQRKYTDPNDMYQGSRAVANMVTCFRNHIKKQIVELETECNQAIARLRTATTTEFHQAVEYVEQHVELLAFADLGAQEESRVSQIVGAVQHHQNHLISNVVRGKSPPTTFEQLRRRMATLPYDEPSGTATGVFSAVTAFLTGATVGTKSSAPGNALPRQEPGVHTQRYVDRLKKRLRHAEDLARQHGVSEKEFQLPFMPRDSSAPPPSQSFRRGGRGGGGRGGHSRHGGAGPATASAVVSSGCAHDADTSGTSPTPNQIVEAFPAFVAQNAQEAQSVSYSDDSELAAGEDDDASPLPPEKYPEDVDFDWTSGFIPEQTPVERSASPLSVAASSSPGTDLPALDSSVPAEEVSKSQLPALDSSVPVEEVSKSQLPISDTTSNVKIATTRGQHLLCMFSILFLTGYLYCNWDACIQDFALLSAFVTGNAEYCGAAIVAAYRATSTVSLGSSSAKMFYMFPEQRKTFCH